MSTTSPELQSDPIVEQLIKEEASINTAIATLRHEGVDPKTIQQVEAKLHLPTTAVCQAGQFRVSRGGDNMFHVSVEKDGEYIPVEPTIETPATPAAENARSAPPPEVLDKAA